MPTLRWFGGRWVMSSPSIVIVPAVGCSKPAIMRSVVVLPQPDGPRNETNSPRSAARLKSCDGDDRAELLLRRRSARGSPSVCARLTQRAPRDLDAASASRGRGRR